MGNNFCCCRKPNDRCRPSQVAPKKRDSLRNRLFGKRSSKVAATAESSAALSDESAATREVTVGIEQHETIQVKTDIVTNVTIPVDGQHADCGLSEADLVTPEIDSAIQKTDDTVSSHEPEEDASTKQRFIEGEKPVATTVVLSADNESMEVLKPQVEKLQVDENIWDENTVQSESLGKNVSQDEKSHMDKTHECVVSIDKKSDVVEEKAASTPNESPNLHKNDHLTTFPVGKEAVKMGIDISGTRAKDELVETCSHGTSHGYSAVRHVELTDRDSYEKLQVNKRIEDKHTLQSDNLGKNIQQVETCMDKTPESVASVVKKPVAVEEKATSTPNKSPNLYKNEHLVKPPDGKEAVKMGVDISGTRAMNVLVDTCSHETYQGYSGIRRVESTDRDSHEKLQVNNRIDDKHTSQSDILCKNIQQVEKSLMDKTHESMVSVVKKPVAVEDKVASTPNESPNLHKNETPDGKEAVKMRVDIFGTRAKNALVETCSLGTSHRYLADRCVELTKSDSRRPSTSSIKPPRDHSLLQKELSLLPNLQGPSFEDLPPRPPSQKSSDYELLRQACLNLSRALNLPASTTTRLLDVGVRRTESLPAVPLGPSGTKKELEREANVASSVCRAAVSTPNLANVEVVEDLEELETVAISSDSSSSNHSLVKKKVSDFPVPKQKYLTPLKLNSFKKPPKHMFAVPAVAKSDVKNKGDIKWTQVESNSPRAQMPWTCKAPRFNVAFPPLGARLLKRMGSIECMQQKKVIPQIRNIERLKLEDNRFPGLRVRILRRGQDKYSFCLPKVDMAKDSGLTGLNFPTTVDEMW